MTRKVSIRVILVYIDSLQDVCAIVVNLSDTTMTRLKLDHLY